MVRFVARYSNKIESVGLRKCPYYRYLIEKVTSTDVRTTNILQSLPYKMAENMVSVIISVGYTDTKFYYQCGPH